MTTSIYSDLITQVRYLINEPSAADFTDAEIGDYLNKSHRHYWNLIIQKALDFFVVSTDFVNTENTTTHLTTATLNSDFMIMRRVEQTMTDTVTNPLQYNKINFYERQNYLGSGIRCYYLQGDTIYFLNAPTEAISLYYIKEAPTIASDTAPFNSDLTQHYDLLAYDTAIKCKTRDEADISGLVLERNRLEQDLWNTISQREDDGVNYIKYNEDHFN